jgi:hypothetical protein
MKPYPIAVIALLVTAGSARAQEALPRVPLSRGDLQIVVGWQNLEENGTSLPRQDNWINSIFWGGAGAGWYWTDHLKTHVDIGAGTEGSRYRYESTVVNGRVTSSSSRFGVRVRSVAVAQHYQFYRNRLLHPYVGGGAVVERVTERESYEPVFIYDNEARVSRLVVPARSEGPSSRTVVKPFGTVGLKAYFTRRAFFTTDMRAIVEHGVDEVLFRFGFGADF